MSRIARRNVVPVNQITPLTYRDGVTYIQMLTELSEYIQSILHPSLQHTVDQLVSDVETQMGKHHDQYVDGVQEFQRIHDAFMSDVNAKLMALNDGAVSDLAEDDTSLLGKVLRGIFSSHEDFTEYQASIDSKFRQHQGTTEQQMDSIRDDVTTIHGEVDDQLTGFEHTMGTRLDGFESTMSTRLDATEQRVDQELARERQITNQTDIVNILGSRSNFGHLELRVTGTGQYPSFSVYRVYDGGGSGFFAETTFAGGAQSGNDEYHRMWQTHVGYARNRGDSFEYERRVTISPASNSEFALRFKPENTSAQSQWFPRHNNINTAFRASEPLFMTPHGRLRVSEGDLRGTVRIDGHLDIIQHVYARHPDSGDRNILEMWTTHRFTPDGVITVTGRYKTLEPVIFDSGYVLMMPGNPSHVQRLVSSLGNAYSSNTSKYGTSDTLGENDQGVSYGFITSGAHNVTMGVTYDNAHETLRRGKPGKPVEPAFLEHRNSSVVKLYHQLFEKGTRVPAGTVHRFSGRYVHAYSPKINDFIDVV